MAKTLISTPYDFAVHGAVCKVDITSGIDSTYPVYEFHFVNIHAQVGGQRFFKFQVNAAGGDDFDEAITSTYLRAYHEEGLGYALGIRASLDQANADEVYQVLTENQGVLNDESCAGVLTLYDPSSTTYVKHFLAEGNGYDHGNWAVTMKTAGYINTTSAIDEISFKFDAGDIENGVIKMFGVS